MAAGAAGGYFIAKFVLNFIHSLLKLMNLPRDY